MTVAVVSALKVLVLATVGGTGLPFGVPPAAEDPILARTAPEECLLYAAWSGPASPAANSGNQTEQLLAEPEVQHLLTETQRLIKSALDRSIAEAGADDETSIEYVQTLGGVLITHPTMLFVERFDISGDVPVIRGGLVCNLGDDVDATTRFLERIREAIPAEAQTEVTIDGVKMRRLSPPRGAPQITYGMRGRHLIVGVGEEAVEGIFARAKTEPPGWLTALVKRLPVERRSVVKYVNVKGVLKQVAGNPLGEPVVKGIQKMGAGNVESLGVVAGLDKSEFATRILLKVDGKPDGLLSLAAGAPLTAADLSPIPRDATLAVAARVDPTKAIETFRDTVGRVSPEFPAMFDAQLGSLEEGLGLRLRADLIGSLGDVWCVYHSPGEGGLLMGAAAVVTVKDRARLADALDRLRAVAEENLEALPGEPRLEQEEFRGQTIHYVPPFDDDVLVSPAWCLTDDALIVALFPQTIRTYLSRGDDFRSLATQPGVAEAFAADVDPAVLVYQDTPRLLELAYPFLQMGSRAMIGELQRDGFEIDETMLPSLQALRRHLRPGVSTLTRADDGLEFVSRQTIPFSGSGPVLLTALGAGVADPRALEGVAMLIRPGAARESQSMNNLRQIVIAMHNYHDVNGEFPQAYTETDDHKPLLSWRVHILPYIEQDHLYRQFHLDEPWDSEHNKALIAQMPETYRAPGTKAEAGRTNYLTIRGKGTIFPGKAEENRASRLASVVDGTSNTILAVEAGDAKAVVWTKPDDYDFDPMNPIRGLPGLRGKAFLAAFADGYVRKLSTDLDPEMFRRLFLRNDGQVVRFDDR